MQLHYSTALEGARASAVVQSQLFDNQDMPYDDLTFAAVLPEQFLEIRFEVVDPQTRRLEFFPHGPRYEGRRWKE